MNLILDGHVRERLLVRHFHPALIGTIKLSLGVSSEVIEENVRGETYTLEYVVSAPDAPKRHIQSVFALRSQESVIGLTVQTKEVLQQLTPSLAAAISRVPVFIYVCFQLLFMNDFYSYFVAIIPAFTEQIS